MDSSLPEPRPFLLSQTKLAAISGKTEHKILQQQGMFPSVWLIVGCSHKRAAGEFPMLGRGSASFCCDSLGKPAPCKMIP